MHRPNLLFLYTDEQAARTMAAYGNDQIEMPNLNRLAQQSLVFQQAYVTQPVCTPSRSSILTGLYPHSNGCDKNNVPLADDVKCLPELSDFSDYRTAHMGKWHLGDEIFAQHGFNEWISTEDSYRGYYNPWRDRDRHCDYWHWLTEEHGIEPPQTPDGFNDFGRGVSARLPEEVSKPAFLAERAGNFLDEVGDDPFVLFVNFLEPHMPFFGPRDGQYDPDEVPLPENFDAVPGPNAPLKHRLLYEHFRNAGISGLPLRTEADWKRLIANYWGLCSQVDTAVGRVLDALDRNGQTDDTIVVFTSDHGDMMGSHQLVAKTVMFEESTRVPLTMRVPWVESGARTIEQPVSQVDLVPTLLDLMGHPSPSHLQGQSWRPALRRGEDLPDRDVVIEWNGPDNGMIRQGRDMPAHIDRITNYKEAWEAVNDRIRTIVTPTGWKFNCSPMGEHELYNLREDPGERRNLIDDAAVSELVADLYERLLEWQRLTDDDAHLGSDPRSR